MEPESERPILNLEDEKTALGPLRRDLLTTYQRWMNDFETVKTLGRTAKPVTAEAQSEWLDKMLPGSERDVVFTIYERRTGGTWRPAGCTGLHEIDHLQGKATFGILVGEPEARGRGVGTEATRLVLDYAFSVLHLHNVLLTVYAYNSAATRRPASRWWVAAARHACISASAGTRSTWTRSRANLRARCWRRSSRRTRRADEPARNQVTVQLDDGRVRGRDGGCYHGGPWRRSTRRRKSWTR